MNIVAANQFNTLPSLIDRAASALQAARSSAEVLEARDMASLAYDAAKRAARIQKAKGAHDELIAAAHRAQADALEIEAGAKRRLADEYDAAQERGEVARVGNPSIIPDGNNSARVGDIGLSSKDVHEGRIIRDAESESPGIVRQALDAMLKSGEEPTKAKVRRAVVAKSKRKRHARPDYSGPTESQHDRDLRMLMGVWDAACESAREEFLENVS